MIKKVGFCFLICALFGSEYASVLRLSSSGDTVEPVPTCPQDSGDIIFFPTINCSTYWECANDQAFLRPCPADLEFSPTLDVCVEPEDAGCTGEGWSTLPPTTTTSTTELTWRTTKLAESTSKIPVVMDLLAFYKKSQDRS